MDAGLDVIAQISAPSPPQGFRVRLGIASGLALATEAQVIGEPSFVAIGLCDLASPNSILVAASTRRLLGNRFVSNQPQNLLEQLPGNGALGHLEGNGAAMTADLGADLDQLLLQARQRPVLDWFRRRQRA